MYRSNDMSWGGLIALFIVLCIVMTCCNSMNISDKRSDANMVYLEEGFCYDADTQIIYRETIVDGGRYFDSVVFTPYINENGNYCKYEHGEWVELIKDHTG